MQSILQKHTLHAVVISQAYPVLSPLLAVNFNGLPTLVDMRSRPVLARFRCQGRINHDPFNYRPLWVPAQLILYERPEPMFSVLFDDRGERIKHIMDFTPVPLPCDSAQSSAK